MGFIGNILGNIVDLVSPGIPIVGGKLGDFVSSQARKLPFKTGGVVMNPIIAEAKRGKGTQAMKAKMARLRAMRGKKKAKK